MPAWVKDGGRTFGYDHVIQQYHAGIHDELQAQVPDQFRLTTLTLDRFKNAESTKVEIVAFSPRFSSILIWTINCPITVGVSRRSLPL